MSHKPNASCVIGICPGTRHVSLALVKEAELRDQRIKSFHGTWNGKKKEAILECVCSYAKAHQATHAFLKPVRTRRHEQVLELIESLTEALRGLDMHISVWTLTKMKTEFGLKDKEPIRRLHIQGAFPHCENDIEVFCPEDSHEDKRLHAVALALSGFRSISRAPDRISLRNYQL